MTGKRKCFYVNDDVNEVLKEVKENTPGINNLSQALRYIVLKHNNEIESKEGKKYNAISKEVSILLEITANVAAANFNKIEYQPVDDIEIYKEAKKIVEERIRVNTTKSMKYKHQNKNAEGIATEKTLVNKFDE